MIDHPPAVILYTGAFNLTAGFFYFYYLWQWKGRIREAVGKAWWALLSEVAGLTLLFVAFWFLCGVVALRLEVFQWVIPPLLFCGFGLYSLAFRLRS